MSRATAILERFPAHLEAARPGKRIGAVAEALARPLDLLAADLGAIRRSHRPGEADELVDLLRIAALHGFAGADFAPVLLRVEEAGYRVRVEALRARLLGAVRVARLGQGTVRSLLEGAASALGLTLGEAPRIEHSRHRFWHAAYATDALAPLLAPPAVPGTPPVPPAIDVIGLEENPLRRETTGPQARRHGETWTLRRRGFGAVHLDVSFRGREDRTIGPMLVQRDQGVGVGLAAQVPAGSVVTFTDDGRVLLDGADASGLAYAWTGACFAGPDATPERDFVFAPGAATPPAPDAPDAPELPARAARFARPLAEGEADPFAPGASFPVAPRPLGTPEMNVGETRFACFVQVAHFSAVKLLAGLEPGPVPRLVAPRNAIGFFDGSVFAFGGAPPEPQPAVDVELSWLEHEAYAVRLLVPRRFAPLAGGAEKSAAVLAAALERSRPAGVDLRVEFYDDGLVLDDSVLPEGSGSGPLAELWARNALAGGGGGAGGGIAGPNP